ncbi:hypothetical protein PFLA_b0445 [Pseudoalteromonas flavipulchra NCIMB 2033 = ATCC BAA-314]|nr:hypothetical protein [Pseudoalteromonas flavipulchra NCIMB 2033 = ATCC BAA-314]
MLGRDQIYTYLKALDLIPSVHNYLILLSKKLIYTTTPVNNSVHKLFVYIFLK